MIWQILIATVSDRAEQFALLKNELENQINKFDLYKEVGIIFDQDDKQKTIGRKRQDLLERSTAEYISYFDDDDWPYSNYVGDIYNALLTGCDTVGLVIDMTTNGINPQVCCHSLRYPNWETKKDGYDYVRNVTIFNPVKRKLAINIGFKPIRYGEDHDYADRLTPICKNEVFIERSLFHYRYSNDMPHHLKYGLK